MREQNQQPVSKQDQNTAGKSYVLIAVIGIVVGFISGFFGIGGGAILVPALLLLTPTPQKLAHGSSLLAGAMLSSAGATLNGIAGDINFVAAPLVFAGSFWGVLLGTWLLDKVNLRFLLYAFLAVLCVTAVRLFTGSGNPGDGYESLSIYLVVGFMATGLVAGTLSGLLGIGGGIIMVPAFIILFGFPAVIAKGTSLMVIAPTSAIGTLRNHRYGNIDFKVGLTAGVAGVGLSLVGVWLSGLISESLAQLLFAILLITVIPQLLKKAISKQEPH